MEIRLITSDRYTAEWMRAHKVTDDAIYMFLDAQKRVIARVYLGDVSPLIVLWTILRWERKLVRSAIEELSGDLHQLEIAVDEELTNAAKESTELVMDLTRVGQLIDGSIAEAAGMQMEYVCPEHILLALCRLADPRVMRVLSPFNLTHSGVKNWILDVYSRG